MTPVRTVARALLAAIFIKSGLDSVRNPDRLVETAKPTVDTFAPALDAVGLPTDPRTVVRLNGAAQVAGGLMLATGNAPRLGAAVLAGTLVPTTVAGHPFWSIEDPGERAKHRTHFMKNLALLGGLILAAIDTEGRPGLAWRAGHLAGHAQDSMRRAAQTTARETRRAAKLTAKETRRATDDARRAAQTTARETRLAVRAAKLGRRLPS
jgi:putative oxidoreductase